MWLLLVAEDVVQEGGEGFFYFLLIFRMVWTECVQWKGLEWDKCDRVERGFLKL